MSGTTASGWLLHTLAGGGLLLLLAWLWTAWTRQPARRLRVAEWAVAASLLLAVLSLGPAWLVVTTPAAAPAVAVPITEHQPSPLEESRAPAAPAPEAPPVNNLPPAVDMAAPAPVIAPHVITPPAEPAPYDSPSTVQAPPREAWDAERVASVAAGLYLAVGAAVLCRWLLGWLALWRLLRGGEPVTGRAADLFGEMAGDGPRPRLLSSRRARAPFSCGLLRPTVVLPAGLCELAPDGVLRWVFAHELAHLERRDSWSALLFGLGQMVYFAVPWFWRLRRQARLCREYLADAAAASAGGRPEDYAQFLLAWTAAPRPPVGACGVWGRSSDLFWRVKTMLQNPVPLERRCPRRWSLAAACGLLSVAVLAAGFTLRAAAAPAPEPKDEPKKEEPKKAEPAPAKDDADVPGVPNIDEMLKRMPNLTPEMAQRYREMMRSQRDMMRRMMEQQRANGFNGFNFPNVPFNPGFPGGSPQDVRLGVAVEKPGDTLSEQLELPRDQGLVVREVMADSAAAKAGLKAHDILLELDGKAVSSDPEEFRKAVEALKADTPVDAVVLRKGKKETIKGLSLPEAKAAAPGLPGFNPVFPVAPPGGAPNPPVITLPVFPPVFAPPGGTAPAGGVMTTTFRTGDHFTTRHQEGSLVITLTGKVADGKATVNEISVQDGGESKTYDALDKAPEKYRDKIKNLVEMSEKGSVKVEIKAP